ncbi:MAG: M28 family peptidase [Planctomycetota bacterium]
MLPFFSTPGARRTLALALLVLGLPLVGARAQDEMEPGMRFTEGVRQLTFDGRRAGEGYYNHDGTKIVFQSERDPANPFYQIFLMDLETGDLERISPGQGKTTCAWVHPDDRHVLYASTHLDERSVEHQKEELELRASGKARRYEWDYDENFDLFAHDRETGKDRRLTYARGYDAEGSYSPDGKWICFASNRSAYLEPMSEEDRKRFELDKALFMEIYMMRADGSDVRRLTFSRGYDGGPFFSADGKKVCWRRFSEDGLTAEIYTMNVDGSDQRRLTHIKAMSWAPYFHPSGEYLIFTTNRHGFANFELYLVDAAGEKEPVRVTNVEGFDGLPTFTPDGKTIAWTSNRGADKQSQIYVARWDHAAALAAVRAAPKRSDAPAAAHADEPSMPKVSEKTGPEVAAGDLAKHVVFLASKELDGRLTGTEGERLATAYAADVLKALHIPPGGDDGGYFQNFRANRLTMDGENLAITGRNVIGVLPAGEEGRGKPPVIIGAHIDHLGHEGGRYSNARGEDKLLPHLGADDNASGVAGVLEIAEYFAHQMKSGRLKLKRDVIFALWSGEELGLFGSKHFARQMMEKAGTENLSGQVAAYLNMDMIGRFNQKVIISGVGSSSIWEREIERRNAPVGLRAGDRAGLQPADRHHALLPQRRPDPQRLHRRPRGLPPSDRHRREARLRRDGEDHPVHGPDAALARRERRRARLHHARGVEAEDDRRRPPLPRHDPRLRRRRRARCAAGRCRQGWAGLDGGRARRRHHRRHRRRRDRRHLRVHRGPREAEGRREDDDHGPPRLGAQDLRPRPGLARVTGALDAERFDIVGDVHGMIAPYRSLLDALGYRHVEGRWSHPEGRVLVSVGDLVDRGPDPLGCLELTEALIEDGVGLAVLGNHEVNLVHLVLELATRPHRRKQAKNSMAQIRADRDRWERCFAFLSRLPFALKLAGDRLRVVHAAWDDDHLAALPPRLATLEDWAAIAPDAELSPAADHVLRGPEEESAPYRDSEGFRRTRRRVHWWKDHPAGAPDLAFGHYSMKTGPRTLGPGRNAICVDWGVAYGRPLVAWRWPERTFLDSRGTFTPE